jgi:hypothetical protein
MWEKISSAGKKQCPAASEYQSQGCEQKQWAAITKDCAKEGAVR